MLRANLRYFKTRGEVRSLLVTSAAPAEGKSTVALNLAITAAEAGTSVLLVEADLRHPFLARTLRLNDKLGLGSLLIHDEEDEQPLRSVVQSIAIADRTNGKGSEAYLDVLVAGPPPPNPSELLESSRMQAVLLEAERQYSLVVIDAPPAMVVSDAIPLMQHVSGVIVVGRLGSTTLDSATRLRDQLKQLDAPTLGVVANFGQQRAGYHYYAYRGAAT